VTGDLSQDKPLEPTDLLALGPYTVVGLIGQGGMGRVYSARAADGTRVAIKALIAHAAAREAAMPRFRRELAAARRIEGELTARVVDADLEADPPWLATEYIHGPTLMAVVDALGPLPPPAVAALAMGVASALTDIHAAGVVHRDLKPSNILLTADGLRVVDFGIARTSDGTTLTGGNWTLGTPAFMAPEQVVGEPVVAATDVFTLGSVLVYAATGEPPFGRDEATAVMYRTVHDAPELTGVLEPLRAVVEDCLEKDPSARPTPAEVIDRTFALLGRAPARRLAEEDGADGSGPAAETVVTPVLDPPPPRAERPAYDDEPSWDGPVLRRPASAAPSGVTAWEDPLLPRAERPTHEDEPSWDGPVFPRAAPGGSATWDDPAIPWAADAATDASSGPATEEDFAPSAAVFGAGSGFGTGSGPDSHAGTSLGPAFGAGTGLGVRSDATPKRRFRRGVPRSRRAVILTVGAMVAAAATIAAVAVSTQRSGSAPQPGQQMSLGAAPRPAGSEAGRSSHQPSGSGAAPAPGRGSTGTGPAALPGRFVAGPGCAASPWSDTVRSLPAGDQFVPNVTGGDPQCGGVAAAFRKSGSTTVTDAGFTWEFHLRRAARCTLSIYVAAIDSSSGGAIYELTAAGTTTQFAVNQAMVRGQWVQPAAAAGVRLPDGVLRLRLTDAGGFVGDRFHVTASSVRADCC
jgi:serine/threonine protein kinase